MLAHDVADIEKSREFARLRLEAQQKGREPGALIPLLQKIQESFGYVPQVAIEMIAQETRISESEVFGVMTFYKQFRSRPLGKYFVRLCDGTACHVNDSKTLLEILREELKLEGEGEDTSADGLFTLQPVACLGCCSLAPVIMINDETHGRLTPQKLRRILREYRAREKSKPSQTGGN